MSVSVSVARGGYVAASTRDAWALHVSHPRSLSAALFIGIVINLVIV